MQEVIQHGFDYMCCATVFHRSTLLMSMDRNSHQLLLQNETEEGVSVTTDNRRS
jgi:hypothetical protein